MFGLAPAWRAASPRGGVAAAGSLSARGTSEPPRLRLGRTLLVVQMALSLALVSAAALLVESLRRLEHVDTGFDVHGLLLFDANPLLNGYDEGRIQQYWHQALRRLRQAPGIADATVVTHALIANSSSSAELYYRRRTERKRRSPWCTG